MATNDILRKVREFLHSQKNNGNYFKRRICIKQITITRN